MSLVNKSFVVVPGTPLVLNLSERVFAHAISYIVKCGAGGTCTADISNSALANSDPNNIANIWAPSGAGTMTDVLVQEVARYAPCQAIRFTAAGANAIVEMQG